MTEYIIRNRLELRPVMRGPPGVDTIGGKGEIVHERLTLPLQTHGGAQPPPYRLELVRARVFSRDKVTPLNRRDARDQAVNNGPTVLIEMDTSKSSGRFIKLDTDGTIPFLKSRLSMIFPVSSPKIQINTPGIPAISL